MSVAFQFVDVAIVVFVLISAVYATYRGFVAESLSIFGWLAAAVATVWFGPWTASWMQDMVEPRWLGKVVGYAVVFVVVLLPIAFAASRFAESVKKSHVGTLDGALGAAFGILRGLAVVGILYLVYTAIYPIPQQGEWISKAQLLPVVRTSAEVVASLIPDQDVARKHRGRERSVETPAAPPRTAKPAPAAHHGAPAAHHSAAAAKPAKPKPVKKTYGARDRQALDSLVETSNGNKSGKP